jgi:DNA polymerase V
VLELYTATNDTLKIVQMALKGLKSIYRKDYIYKKAGVIVHVTSPESQLQLSIFDKVDRVKRKYLMNAYDTINHRMDKDTVRLTVEGQDRKWKMKQEKLSPCYTTRMTEILEVRV